MTQLVQLFKNSKSFIVMEPISVEVAVDGFASSSTRKLPVGTHLTLIGGNRTEHGNSYFKTNGIHTPIKIANKYRIAKQLRKVLPLLSTFRGNYACGTPFKKGTSFFLLGGKSKNANLIAYQNGKRYHLTLSPQQVVDNFILNTARNGNLFVQERNHTTNMHSDIVSKHFGKETRNSRFA